MFAVVWDRDIKEGVILTLIIEAMVIYGCCVSGSSEF